MCEMDMDISSEAPSNIDISPDTAQEFSDVDIDSELNNADVIEPEMVITQEEFDNFLENTDDKESLENLRDSLTSGEIAVDGMEELPDGTDIDNELNNAEILEDTLVITPEEFENAVGSASSPEELERLRDKISSGEIIVAGDDFPEEIPDDDQKILTREITPELLESHERDTNETLDNYRENLRDLGVPDDKIEPFIAQEREKINADFENDINGRPSDEIYHMPTDWQAVADSLSENEEVFTESAELSDELSDTPKEPTDADPFAGLTLEELDDEELVEITDTPPENSLEGYSLDELENEDQITEPVTENITDTKPDIIEPVSDGTNDNPNENFSEELSNTPTNEINEELDETEINYEEIYEAINDEALSEGFSDINIDHDPEILNSSLESFTDSQWENLTIDEQKVAMDNLAEYVRDSIGFEDPPVIEYYYNEKNGDYGGYNPNTNTLSVNEYMLYDNNEAADTIAHELWHAHQYECSRNPQSSLDYQYQYNFDNYISPEYGQEAYESQLVEAEARAFAAQFKDRLASLKNKKG